MKKFIKVWLGLKDIFIYCWMFFLIVGFSVESPLPDIEIVITSFLFSFCVVNFMFILTWILYNPNN